MDRTADRATRLAGRLRPGRARKSGSGIMSGSTLCDALVARCPSIAQCHHPARPVKPREISSKLRHKEQDFRQWNSCLSDSSCYGNDG